MRFTFLTGNDVTAVLHRVVMGLIGMLVLASAPKAEDLTCSLGSPALAVEGETARITLQLNCTGAGTAIAPDTDLVVGLTTYGERLVEEEVISPGEMPANPENAERVLLADDFYESFDFPAADVRIEAGTTTMEIVFEAPAASIKTTRYWLFAAWRGGSRQECDRSSRYARQGCRDYGYLIDYDRENGLIMSYPGYVMAEVMDGMGHPHVVERWVAERFQ